MKKLLAQYSAYNLWANKSMVDCLHQNGTMLPELSHKKLMGTLSQLWDEESIW